MSVSQEKLEVTAVQLYPFLEVMESMGAMAGMLAEKCSRMLTEGSLPEKAGVRLGQETPQKGIDALKRLSELSAKAAYFTRESDPRDALPLSELDDLPDLIASWKTELNPVHSHGSLAKSVRAYQDVGYARHTGVLAEDRYVPLGMLENLLDRGGEGYYNTPPRKHLLSSHAGALWQPEEVEPLLATLDTLNTQIKSALETDKPVLSAGVLKAYGDAVQTITDHLSTELEAGHGRVAMGRVFSVFRKIAEQEVAPNSLGREMGDAVESVKANFQLLRQTVSDITKRYAQMVLQGAAQDVEPAAAEIASRGDGKRTALQKAVAPIEHLAEQLGVSPVEAEDLLTDWAKESGLGDGSLSVPAMVELILEELTEQANLDALSDLQTRIAETVGSRERATELEEGHQR